MMRILITGFGPFPGISDNPSGRIARAVAAETRWARLGWRVEDAVLPVSYGPLTSALGKRLKETPDVVLMLGVAGREKALRVERRAINRVSTTARGQSGALPKVARLEASVQTFRPARAATADALRVLKAMVPARISASAGRYACNAAYWQALGAVPPGKTVLFVHIPKPRARHAKRDSRPTLTAMTRAISALTSSLALRQRLRR